MGRGTSIHSSNALTDVQITLLSCMLPQLETLHLNGNPLTPDRVSDSPILPHLTSISVDECQLRSWEHVLAIMKALPS